MTNCERCLNNPMGAMCTSIEMQNTDVLGSVKCIAWEKEGAGSVKIEEILREQALCSLNPKRSFAKRIRSYFLDYAKNLLGIIPRNQIRSQLS